MKCKILHESAGRIRVHIMHGRMTMHQADMLEYYLKDVSSVVDAKVYVRTGDATIRYIAPDRALVLEALRAFSYESEEIAALVPEHTGRALNTEFEDKLVSLVVRRALNKLFVPMPIRIAITAVRSVHYLHKGASELLKRKLTVPVLDATAIGVSLLRADFKTASSIMWLLSIGELLEEWTHKKSVDDLARTMALNVEKVWRRVDDDQEELVSINEIDVGDEVVARMGNMIPLDGKVVSGDAMVNQASMTGESVPVHKETGSYVYAGTVVEEGSCVIRVDKLSGGGRSGSVQPGRDDSDLCADAQRHQGAGDSDG